MRTAEWHIQQADALLEQIDWSTDSYEDVQTKSAQARAHAAVARAMNTRRRTRVGGPY